MGCQFRLISAVAFGASYLVSSGKIVPSWWPIAGFVANFATLWTVQFVAWASWAVILWPKFLSPLRGLPEPTDNSLFHGQFHKIRKLPTGVPMREWINSIPNDGLIRYLGLFNQERLVVTSHKTLAEVLVTKNYDFEKPSTFQFFLGRILGYGILLVEGETHKMQRKNLLPAFAFRHVKDLYPVFWSKSQECVQAMTDHISQDETKSSEDKNTAVIEVGGWASRATLDIIGVAGLGHDFRTIENPNNKLNQTYQNMFSPSRSGKRNLEINEAARVIRATCADLIAEKKEKRARKEQSDVDILSVALESGGFSDENLVDQLMTFLAAGHETTASAMTWATYLLARHPDVQTRLRAEIRAHLPSPAGGDAAVVSSLDIDHMPYLNAVCNEVLRYFSPVPLTLRTTACDTSINGQFVPKGTSVVLAPWAVNKSESMWGPDALEFNPDRWMAKFAGDKDAASGGAKSNFAFLTFLHGPRSCIGQGFAKAEFACLLAAWAGRFEFELNDKEELDETKIKIEDGVTARPAKGLFVKTRVVEGW
ncbi:cytochrome P450 [Bombardia bombarda]|uniref:Cytochrome P450 n=1 Tax=Bombardia bombarda TaxID=252184 RepID=A0AA39WMS9_9PEZI|nr:cytochrome P450 [Bombardia bombarda]